MRTLHLTAISTRPNQKTWGGQIWAAFTHLQRYRLRCQVRRELTKMPAKIRQDIGINPEQLDACAASMAAHVYPTDTTAVATDGASRVATIK